jgi:hypothetical protein
MRCRTPRGGFTSGPGKAVPDGESLSTLIGMAAYVYMSYPVRGAKHLEALRELDRAEAARTPAE